ncbi:ABC transporter ATP-binding protein [Jiella pacifica]|uniref:ATP-binding cassette domain-containing protein n=1 Tax=Jiella pacifica TaxID=2696469 RepID=A0A6N9T3F4_9HYPH|nr:ABC transporter ATP-binding protein [Jiella pacifica]NDW05904.1 ATP-binding cassette domain-containing protein [Jiella pacifica]
MSGTSPDTPLLCVRDLHVSYGPVEAVGGISLDVPRGAIVSVIGPNGAGKSTLLNALMGLLPSKGQATLDGRDVAAMPVEDRLRRGLCLVSEKRELFAEMSVADNLALGAYSRRHEPKGAVEADLEAGYQRFPRLKERRHQTAGTLSGGERQMLAIARALMARPQLLMLDEPSLGLAPLIVAEVLETVSELRRSGVSILIVEQNARAVLRIADYGYVLEQGRIAMEGDAATLLADERLIQTYLGFGKGEAAA